VNRITIPTYLESQPVSKIAAALGVSRQYVYQIQRLQKGLCIACGKAARPGKVHCEKHAKRAARQTRARLKQRRKNTL